MLPKSSIEKGKRLEKIVCQMIEGAGLGRAIRTPGSGNGKLKGDTFNNLPFMLEVKNHAKLQWWASIRQAKDQAQKGNYDKDKWAMITRNPDTPETNPEMVAVIDFGEFLELMKKDKEPIVKEPDREFKYKVMRLKQSAQEVIKCLD